MLPHQNPTRYFLYPHKAMKTTSNFRSGPPRHLLFSVMSAATVLTNTARRNIGKNPRGISTKQQEQEDITYHYLEGLYNKLEEQIQSPNLPCQSWDSFLS